MNAGNTKVENLNEKKRNRNTHISKLNTKLNRKCVNMWANQYHRSTLPYKYINLTCQNPHKVGIYGVNTTLTYILTLSTRSLTHKHTVLAYTYNDTCTIIWYVNEYSNTVHTHTHAIISMWLYVVNIYNTQWAIIYIETTAKFRTWYVTFSHWRLIPFLEKVFTWKINSSKHTHKGCFF